VGARAYYATRTDGTAAISTARLSRGSIVQTVGATATVQAVTTVQVGTQVSGTISWLGADFNSVVRKGQTIARLDPSFINAQIEQAQANLSRVEADVENARVKVSDAQQKYDRAQALAARQLLAQSDLDAAAVAVSSAKAALKASEAQAVQARAALNQNRVNLEHAIITAPIDGIVINRSVDVGQTVAASLSSPTLFTIAADLAKMQLQTEIDESDIGRIEPGQPVTFTVDAYPGERFSGTTSQVRLQPNVVQNVTTYTVMVDVSNRDLKLRPGMTATVDIEIARKDDVLRVPNAALHFAPSAATLKELGVDADPAMAGGKRDLESTRVFVRENDQVRSIPVSTGLTDAQWTEIVSGDVNPAAEIVTGVRSSDATARPTAGRNIFSGTGIPGGGFSGGGRR
jgi:HlyD family secretion protein